MTLIDERRLAIACLGGSSHDVVMIRNVREPSGEAASTFRRNPITLYLAVAIAHRAGGPDCINVRMPRGDCFLNTVIEKPARWWGAEWRAVTFLYR